MSLTTIDPKIVYKNTFDGLVLSWDDLSSTPNFKGYLLLRKRYDYSSFVNDGDVILRGKDTVVKDMTVKNGLSYYYTLFLIVSKTVEGVTFDDYVTSNRFHKNIVVHKLAESVDKLYNSLPPVYRTTDKKVLSQIPLPLYRYLSLMGYQFDKIENLISLILDNIDIDSCDEKFLPIIANWLGVSYDWSLSVTDNRVLTKLMIENYSRKGTYDGLKALLQNISQSKVEIFVDKTLTPVNGTPEQINQRRKVLVEIYLDDENGSWVASKQDKVFKVIDQNVPKKNSYNVRVVILFEYADVYDSKKLNAIYELTFLKEHHDDTFLKVSDKNGISGFALRGYDCRGGYLYLPVFEKNDVYGINDIKHFDDYTMVNYDIGDFRGVSKRGYDCRGGLEWDYVDSLCTSYFDKTTHDVVELQDNSSIKNNNGIELFEPVAEVKDVMLLKDDSYDLYILRWNDSTSLTGVDYRGYDCRGVIVVNNDVVSDVKHIDKKSFISIMKDNQSDILSDSFFETFLTQNKINGERGLALRGYDLNGVVEYFLDVKDDKEQYNMLDVNNRDTYVHNFRRNDISGTRGVSARGNNYRGNIAVYFDVVTDAITKVQKQIIYQ